LDIRIKLWIKYTNKM